MDHLIISHNFMLDIFNLANNYLINVLASTRSKTFNLNYFKSLPLEEMIDYPMLTLKFLGKGSSRETYIVSSKKVLKIAYNDAGIHQNRKEVETHVKFGNSGMVTKVYDSDPNGMWILAELVRPFKGEQEFYDFTGIYPSKIPYVEDGSVGGSIYQGPGREFALKVQKFAKDSGLRIGDFISSENYGINSDSQVVILDYGFDDEVYNKYYNDVKEEIDKKDIIIKSPEEAYLQIKKDNEEGLPADSSLENIVCKSPYFAAKLFNISSSDKNKCETAMVKDEYVLYSHMLTNPDADIDYLSGYLINYPERATRFLEKRPKYLSLLKTKPAWKEITDYYEKYNKEFMTTASIRSKDFNLNFFKTLSYPHSYNYAADNLELIGSGTSRFAFILSSKKVLKLAGNDFGLRQNKVEVSNYTKTKNKELFPKIFDCADDGAWIVAELVRPFQDNDEFFDSGVSNNEEINEKLREDELNRLEVMTPSQWGKNTDGRNVILDPGVDEDLLQWFLNTNDHQRKDTLKGSNK